MSAVYRDRDARELQARIRSEAPGHRHRPRGVRKRSRARIPQDEDGDSSVDESNLLQAAQGERRAAESGIWWSVASVIGPVSASS